MVTTAIVVELFVEMFYQGCGRFWLPRAPDSDGRQGIAVLPCAWNWFQVLVALACVVALPFYLAGPSEGALGAGVV